MKNCKNFWKRGISLALALMMCLSLLPVNAFAADAHEHVHTTLASETCQHENAETRSKGNWLAWRLEYKYCPNCNKSCWYIVGRLSGYVYYEGDWVDGDDPGEVPDLECKHQDTEVRNAKEATCKEKGYSGDTYCKDCGNKIATGKETPVAPNNHVNTEVRGAVTATCQAGGYTGDTYCNDCGNLVEEGEETQVDPTNHDGETEVRGAVTATCKDGGKTGDTYCLGCGEKISDSTDTQKDPDNHAGGTEVRDAVEATCTKEGYTGDTYCLGCNTKIANGETIEKLAHTYGTEWEKDATNHWHECSCGAKADKAEHDFAWANGEWKCKDCGYVDGTTLCGHEGTLVPDVDPADYCEDTKVETTAHCTHCGATGLAYTVVGTGSHTYGSWSDSADKHCVGSTFDRTRTCTKCGHEDTQKDLAGTRQHKLSDIELVGGVVWNDGSTFDTFAGASATVRCKYCDWTETVTFDRASSTTVTATSCGDRSVKRYKVYVQVTAPGQSRPFNLNARGYQSGPYHSDPLPHVTDPNPTWEWAADNTKAQANFKCTRCGTTFGHAFAYQDTGTIEVTGSTPAACVTGGTITYTATVEFEGKTYTDTHVVNVAATGHTLKTIPAKAATCTEDGWKKHWQCTVCGAYTHQAGNPYPESEWTIEATGHDWGEWTVNGSTATRTCKNDPTHTETENLPVVDEETEGSGSEGKWNWTVTPATCTTDGSVVYVFNDDNSTFSVVIPKLGHAWGDWTVTTDPTADAEGAAERTCERCGGTETKTLPALGGNGGEGTGSEWTYAVTVEPGCTTNGVGTYTYTEDGSTVTVTIPAIGHAWGDWTVALEPTYAAEGLEIRTCTNGCGETQTRVIAALELPEGGLGGDTEEPEIEIEDEQTPLAGMPYALNPEDLLTRGHLMYVLHWFDGEPEAEISTFIDVAFEAYYSVAIGWAQDENIARGTPDNKFMPEDTVTRGQMEVFLTRYAEYLGLDMEVVLVGDDSDLMFWAEAETILNEFFASLPVEA